MLFFMAGNFFVIRPLSPLPEVQGKRIKLVTSSIKIYDIASKLWTLSGLTAPDSLFADGLTEK